MFQLTTLEVQKWISQIVISNVEKMGLRKASLVFTEQRVAMLSSVLNSDRAIIVNIKIIRVFTKMRQMLETYKKILRKSEQLENKDIEQNKKIMIIFEYLKQLEQSNRKRIGFKTAGNN